MKGCSGALEFEKEKWGKNEASLLIFFTAVFCNCEKRKEKMNEKKNHPNPEP